MKKRIKSVLSELRKIIIHLWKEDRKFPPLLIGVAVFAVICFLIIYFNYDLLKSGYKEFIISFAASFLEDLIFFLLIGAIATYISIKDPSNDHIDRRARWLFNGKRFDEGALLYIREKATNLAIYSPLCEITVTFEEINSDGLTVKANIKSTRKFANLMSDAAHKKFLHEYSAESDDFYSSQVNGELTLVSTGVGASKKNRSMSPKPLPLGGLKESVIIEIDGDGESEFEHAFWVWYEIGKNFFFSSHQYTTRVVVRVINESEKEICLNDLRSKDRRPILTKGQSVEFNYGPCPASREEPFQLLKVT